MTPSKQRLSAWLPLEFELLERILGDPLAAFGIQIVVENILDPLAAFES